MENGKDTAAASQRAAAVEMAEQIRRLKAIAESAGLTMLRASLDEALQQAECEAQTPVKGQCKSTEHY